MSRHARAALQRDIDALDLLWREHQDIRRRFRDHDEMVPQAADFDACVAQLAACLLPAPRGRALQASFSRQSMLTTTRRARGPAGRMRVPFGVRGRTANSHSPAPCWAA
jgi:hypothetical protein